MIGRLCEVFISSVPRSPRVSRDLEKCCRAWVALDWDWRLANSAGVGGLVADKSAFARRPQIWRRVFFMLLFRGLRMGFDKPEPFVNAARNLREEIRRVRVVQFTGFIDRLADFRVKGG